MNEPVSDIAIQFDDADQQRSAAVLGMWIFLSTEVLFFGGMLVAYSVYRHSYPDEFQAASEQLNLWAGAAMTAVLLAGSLLVAMSDHLHEREHERDARHEHHAQHGRNAQHASGDRPRRTIVRYLLITVVLGVAFLGLEFYEYASLFGERLFPGVNYDNHAFAHLSLEGRSTQLFFVLFFCMTGLHAVHMMIGISLVAGLACAMHLTQRPSRLGNPLKVIGLYWHFVDIVWIFLYPLFYLVR